MKLEFGAYLGFACLPVGREFVIWDFREPTLCGLLKARSDNESQEKSSHSDRETRLGWT